MRNTPAPEAQQTATKPWLTRRGLAEVSAFAGCVLALWHVAPLPSVAPGAGSTAMKFRTTQVELIEDMSVMCGPGQTTPSGSMSVPVDYFEAAVAGQVFQATQYRHERCAAEGCPTRIFVLTTNGARRLIVNTNLPLVRPAHAGHEAAELLLARDGRTLRQKDRTFQLDGL